MEKNKGRKWNRAVFTVEAAVIVPMTLTLISLLIGYCYYVHQSNWCRGAAYEASLKGAEKDGLREKDGSGAQKRMNRRLQEIPLLVGRIETTVSEKTKVGVSWKGSILPEVFGELFSYSGSASVYDFEPVKIKRLEFLMKSVGE